MEIVKGILGAIIPSCQPKDMTYPSDPVFHMKEVGKNMAKKLKRVGVKTISDLATMTDRDISQATGKTVFISTESLSNSGRLPLRLSRRTRATEARMHISKKLRTGWNQITSDLGIRTKRPRKEKAKLK